MMFFALRLQECTCYSELLKDSFEVYTEYDAHLPLNMSV